MMNNRSIAETPRNRRMAIHRLHAPAVCRLLVCALLVASSGSPGSAWAQMPDNRGVKLNPEDSVPPAYLDTLDERDRVRLDAARQQGDSFVPIFSGRGQAPGYTQPAGGVGSTRSVTESPPCVAAPARRPRDAAAHLRSLQPAAARGPPGRPARRPHIGSDRRAAAEPGANRRGSSASAIRPPSPKRPRPTIPAHPPNRPSLCRPRVMASTRARFMR